LAGSAPNGDHTSSSGLAFSRSDIGADFVSVVRFVGARQTFKQVLRLALFVHIVAAALQDEQVGDVAPQAEASNDEHELAIDFRRVQKAVNCLDQKPDQEAPNYNDTAEGANYISPMVPK